MSDQPTLRVAFTSRVTPKVTYQRPCNTYCNVVWESISVFPSPLPGSAKSRRERLLQKLPRELNSLCQGVSRSASASFHSPTISPFWHTPSGRRPFHNCILPNSQVYHHTASRNPLLQSQNNLIFFREGQQWIKKSPAATS